MRAAEISIRATMRAVAKTAGKASVSVTIRPEEEVGRVEARSAVVTVRWAVAVVFGSGDVGADILGRNRYCVIYGFA